MPTTTENAAREAVQAKPCRQERDAARLVLRAQDEAEDLRAALRAGESIAELAAFAGHAEACISMRAFAELLHLQRKAMDARIEALGNLIDDTRASLAPYPYAKTARSMAEQASDHMCLMRQAGGAFAAFANMAPYARDAEGEELSDAVHVMTGAMNERLSTLETHLADLHAVLTGRTTQGAAA